MLYFNVVRKSDRWYFIDSFENSDEKVKDMVKSLKEDVTDAIAVSLCGLWQSESSNLHQ